MYGIYKYENGLHFTGKIAHSVEEAEQYLGNKFGKMEEVFTGARDKNNYPIYEKHFVPNYNKDAFKIMPLEII